MGRLVGLTVVMVTMLAIGSWFVTGSSDAEATSTPDRAFAVAELDRTGSSELTDDDESVDPGDPDHQDDALPPTDLAFAAPRPHHFEGLDVSSWASGVYAVGDSPDPEVAAADRDVRPRGEVMAIDERLNGDVFAGYAGSRQGEIEPGLYSTDFDATDCGYELWHVARRSRTAERIGEEYLAEGRLLVTINGIEPDWFIADHNCGHWYRWQPRPEPTAPAATGDYWFEDLAPGRWLVPEGCLWEQTVAFRGALLRDVVASGQGPDLIEITEEPLGLRLRSCRSPITLID
ncbi:MAG: hypothetical protein AAFN30_03030 [Actinomycetota bacterium]